LLDQAAGLSHGASAQPLVQAVQGVPDRDPGGVAGAGHRPDPVGHRRGQVPAVDVHRMGRVLPGRAVEPVRRPAGGRDPDRERPDLTGVQYRVGPAEIAVEPPRRLRGLARLADHPHVPGLVRRVTPGQVAGAGARHHQPAAAHTGSTFSSVNPSIFSGTCNETWPPSVRVVLERTIDLVNALANSCSASTGLTPCCTMNALNVATRWIVAASASPMPNATMFGRGPQPR